MKNQALSETPKDTSQERAEGLLGVLNSATLEMQNAMTHDEIFAVMAAELGKHGFTCHVFPCDESQTKLFTKYLRFDSKLLGMVEKLVGINLEDFTIPIKKVNLYKKIFRDQQTTFYDNPEDIAAQILPKATKKYNKKIVEVLNLQKGISAPIIAGGKITGVLSVQSNELTENDVSVVTALSNQFAAAWNKVDLLQDLEEELAERKQIEKALKDSEERFRSIYENTTIGMYRTAPDGRILMGNPALVSMLGYSSFEELAKRNLEKEGYEPDYPRSDFSQQIETAGVVIGIESVWTRHDGSNLYVRESAKAIRDNDGNTLYYEGTVEDITSRKQSEEALRESGEKYRTILENMEEGYFEVDLAGNFTFFNEVTSKTIGYPKEKMMGLNYKEYLDSSNARKVLAAFNRVYKTGEPLKLFDWEITTRDGSKLIVETSISLMRNGEGEPVGFYGIVRDITERKHEENLQAALYDIAQAADRTPTLDAFYKEIHKIIQNVMPADNFYIALHHINEDLISYPYFVDEFEETPGPHKTAKGTTEYVLRTGKSLLCNLRLLEELERSGEATLVGPPSPIWLGVPLIVEGITIGAMVVQHYSDATAYGEGEQRMLEFVSTQVAHAIESKQTEEALLESEAKLAKAQQIAHLAHWENNLLTGEIIWSDELYNIYKQPKELGLPIKYVTDIFSLVHPDDQEASRIMYEKALAGEGEYKIDRRIVCMDGEVRWVHVDGEIQFDENGKPIRLFGTTQDITERKQAEEALRKAEIQTQSRLKEQTILREAISIISSSLELPEIINHIVGEMCKASDATSGYICTWNPETFESTVISEHYSQHASLKERVSDLGETYFGEDTQFYETLMEGHPWVNHIDDPNLSEQERKTFIEFGGKAVLYIPLIVAGEFTFFIELWESRQLRDFTSEQIALCNDIAKYAAVALDNANLFEVAQREIEERIQAEDKYRQLVDNSLVGIYITQNGVRKFCNQRYADIFGYKTPEEMLEQPVDDLISPEDRKLVYREVEARASGQKVFSHYEFKGLKKDSTVIDVEVWATQIMYQGEPATQGAVLDITDRVDSEKRLEYLATHDLMTNLPNRLLFHDRLNHAIDLAKRNNWNGAILFLDLDDFKLVNDAYKHEYGDILLRMVAERLRSFIRRSDTVSRFGGDEFAVLLENISDLANIESIADKILNGLAEPYTIDEIPLFVTASMGISVFPKEGDNIPQLLQNADIAMYQAKSVGNTYKFFTQEMSEEIINNIELGNFLREAVESDNLFLSYQPQYNIITGEVIGFEALLRLSHPSLGDVPPRKFIPIAEKNGTIISIGEWTLEQACATAHRLFKKTKKSIRIAVNISAAQIKQPDFLDMIKRTLKKTKLDPNSLELEITENSFFGDLDEVKNVMEGIKSLGVRLAIDDFGTGYSSLSYLANFPLSTIKVDSSFVKNVEAVGDIAVVEGIVAIAKSLGMELIVEGVETKAQLDAFVSKGCEIIQGWYLSKDVSESKLRAVLKKGVPSSKLINLSTIIQN
jgi:diguanylate cyclase (GGDEF)-like protein/PAS domain S-box-containing protein